MQQPEKPAASLRPFKALLMVTALALCAVSPPAGNPAAADRASEPPGGAAAGDRLEQASGARHEEPAAPENDADRPEAGSVAAGQTPAAEVPAEIAPPSPAAADRSVGSPAGTVAARVPVPAAEKEKVSTVLDAYVGKAASTLARAEIPAVEELAALAVGPAQGTILADAAEFESNGWRQQGAPSVEKLEVVEFDGSAVPQRMTVNACIDSSGVKVVTAEGKTIREGSSSSRSLNILSLVRSGPGGGWVVEQVSFPDDPTC